MKSLFNANVVRFLTATTFLTLTVSSQATAPSLLATTSNGYFGTLNPLTGSFSVIGQDNALLSTYGIAYAANGNLYALCDSSSLYQINVTSGAATLVGTGSVLSSTYAMTGMPDGTLQGYFGDSTSTKLYTINPATGADTLTGDTGAGLQGGIASDEAGRLYITAGQGTETLYGLNPISGLASQIGVTGSGPSFAMAFDGGTLYLADLNNNIWTVDPGTGAATEISTYDGAEGAIFSLVSPDVLSTPEPGTLALLSLGLAGGLLARRRV